MPIDSIPNPNFVVDFESERLTTWPDGSVVYCKDTRIMYRLVLGIFSIIYNWAAGTQSGALAINGLKPLGVVIIPAYSSVIVSPYLFLGTGTAIILGTGSNLRYL